MRQYREAMREFAKESHLDVWYDRLNASELVDYFGTLAQRGVERAYVWFTNFAPDETLREFGQGVIEPLRSS